MVIHECTISMFSAQLSSNFTVFTTGLCSFHTVLKWKSDRIIVVDVHSSVNDLVQTEMSDASFCTSSCEYSIHHFRRKDRHSSRITQPR